MRGPGELTPEQLEILRKARPEELEFLVLFGRNYVNGRWIACLIARTVVGIGAVAGAVITVFSLLRSLGWVKGIG